MALTWNDITGKVQSHIIPRIVDNVYKSSPFFTRLRTRNAERFEGGTSIKHPIAFAELNGAAFQRGGTFNYYMIVELKHRLIQWKPGAADAVVTLTKQPNSMQVHRLSDDGPYGLSYSRVCIEPKDAEVGRNDRPGRSRPATDRSHTCKRTRLKINGLCSVIQGKPSYFGVTLTKQFVV